MRIQTVLRNSHDSEDCMFSLNEQPSKPMNMKPQGIYKSMVDCLEEVQVLRFTVACGDRATMRDSDNSH